MRVTYSVLYIVFLVLLILCAAFARRSSKPIGRSVAFLEATLVPPVLGNLLIISSTERITSIIGCYVYFIGVDLALYSLVNFTNNYCHGISKGGTHKPTFMYYMLAADAVQLALNPFFGHAFDVEPTELDGEIYFALVPHFGQAIHRVIDYIVYLAVILIFTLAVKFTIKLYRERFSVILIALLSVGLLQAHYIFSKNPVDRTIVGYAAFGFVIFYFAICYRPLKLLDRMLSNITSDMSEAIFVFDPNSKCIWANAKGCQLTEVTDNNYEPITQRLYDIFGSTGTKDEEGKVKRIILNGTDIQYFVLEECSVLDGKDEINGTYLRVRDITEEQERIKTEMYDATHDKLTGLYTREYLYTQIRERLSLNYKTSYYIIFIDVKNFKVVNDIFGTDFGDHAIQCIAEWIKGDFSDNCCYGRLAGDTFGVFVPKSEFDQQMLEQHLSKFTIKSDRAEYHLLIHLGVYAVDKADTDVSVMFDRAHLSLSTIQDEYHTHIAFYDDNIREKLLWNQEISAQLHDAIESMQLRPYLQPIADVNGKIVGAEALARWIHPEFGFLPPYKFIPVFERNGMIVEVDKHMWRCACETLSRWQKDDRDLFISVNISPKDFYFIDVVSEIKSLTAEYHISPEKLRIEITETVMMNDADNRMNILEEFRKSGFIVEMDDFGSGYSSLNMLKDMPVDVLKIDMKFLGKTSDTSKSETIIRNIINLSRELGITSLTEGVETKDQYTSLLKMGCKLFQGYYFAKPMPVDEFEAMLSKEQP